VKRVQFSADGIRGIAGHWPLNPLGATTIGCAIGKFLIRQGQDQTVVLGRDPRPSGIVLSNHLKMGLRKQGVNVIDVGMMTTPGVAYLTRHLGANLGLIVSGSHAPFEYNGIKLVKHDGLRLHQEDESKIEELANTCLQKEPAISPFSGNEIKLHNLVEIYIQDHVRRSFFSGYPPPSLEKLALVLDCANGATSQVAPQILRQLGANAIVINDDVKGGKVNDLCGSEYTRANPNELVKVVRKNKASYGFVFDGDGDRLVIVDKDGCLYNGDDILFLLATHFFNRGLLRGNTVVTTKLANSGLEDALMKRNIRVVYTKNGDKNLEAKIWRCRYTLGAEQIGNIIINDGYHAAADSLYAAVIIGDILCHNELKDLVADLVKKPQVLVSTWYEGIIPLEQMEFLTKQDEYYWAIPRKNFRTMVWLSSTEHGRLNIMVEGTYNHTISDVREEALDICKIIEQNADSRVVTPPIIEFSTKF